MKTAEIAEPMSGDKLYKVIPVLESSLPQSLVALKNMLGIEVVECVTPKK